MNAACGRLGIVLIATLCTILVLMGVFSSDGLLLIDEFIYLAGVQAFVETGGFAISNGFERFASDDLRLWLFVDGPSGLVPQYPVGTALAGAALSGVFGQKALIALNIMAGMGTLFFTHALARRLFDDRDVANLAVLILAVCTFWAEYVVAHWPHSVSIFLVTAALWVFLNALACESQVWRPAGAAGLIIGFGLFFRLEVVLVLLPIAVLTVIFARRPIVLLAGGCAGLLPMAVLMAVTNRLRFGSWSPLSYGSSGGGTDPGSYLTIGVSLMAVLSGFVLLRVAGPARGARIWVIGGGVVIALGAVFSTETLALLNKLVGGVHAILIDATAVSDPRIGVQSQSNGTQLFWGLPKKALAQSLPWLGGLALLIGWRRDVHGYRQSVAVVLVVCATWALPFVMRSWHGGLGLNMRYLLPILPPLSALIAWVVIRLVRQGAGWGPFVLAGLLGASIPFFLTVSALAQDAVLHQTVATNLFLTIFVVSLVAGFRTGGRQAGISLAAIGVGLGYAAFLMTQDVSMSQDRRSTMVARSESALTLPGKVVYYGALVGYADVLSNPEQLLALPDRLSGQLDVDFLTAACADGYRIILPQAYVDRNVYLSGWLLPLARGDDVPDATGMAELDCRFEQP